MPGFGLGTGHKEAKGTNAHVYGTYCLVGDTCKEAGRHTTVWATKKGKEGVSGNTELGRTVKGSQKSVFWAKPWGWWVYQVKKLEKGIPGMHNSTLALGLNADIFPGWSLCSQWDAATTSSPGLMVAVAWLVQAIGFHCWLCHWVIWASQCIELYLTFLLWNGREEPHALPTCSLSQDREVQISGCMQKNKHRVMHTCKVVWYRTKSSPEPHFALQLLWHTPGGCWESVLEEVSEAQI